MKNRPLRRFFISLFSSSFRYCLREAGLLAVRGVLLDDAALCRLIDSLISLRKRLGGHLLARVLGRSGEHLLAAHVEDVLLEGSAVGLLC